MRFLYKWQSRDFYAPRWMAFAYYSARRNKCLFVAYPLNFIVALAWWAQDLWARHTGNPSWLEREVEARTEQRREIQFRCRMTYGHRIDADKPIRVTLED